jgi:hypothetical protein
LLTTASIRPQVSRANPMALSAPSGSEMSSWWAAASPPAEVIS